MFERFTDKARTVVILAKARATERGDQIRPVYMLYALASAEGLGHLGKGVGVEDAGGSVTSHRGSQGFGLLVDLAQHGVRESSRRGHGQV